jgi:hypothetical protein
VELGQQRCHTEREPPSLSTVTVVTKVTMLEKHARLIYNRVMTLVQAVKDVFNSDPKSTIHFTEVRKRIEGGHPGEWKMNDSTLQAILNTLAEGGYLAKPHGKTGCFKRNV